MMTTLPLYPLAVALLIFGIDHIAATVEVARYHMGSRDRHLCLLPITPRGHGTLQILQTTIGRKQTELLSSCGKLGSDKKICWRAAKTSSHHPQHQLKTSTIVPNVIDLIESRTSYTETLNHYHHQETSSVSKATTTRFRLVLSPEIATSTAHLARKLEAGTSPSVQLSQDLSDLLMTTLSSSRANPSTGGGQQLQNVFTSDTSAIHNDSINDADVASSPFEYVTRAKEAPTSDQHQALRCDNARAIAAPTIDFTGKWKPIVTKDFLKSYDAFLQACGESYWMRKLLVNAVSLQSQHIRQLDHGRRLEIVDVHPMASWNRTLISSGSDLRLDNERSLSDREIVNHLVDPQGDSLEVVAFWCADGSSHKSILKSSKAHLEGALLESIRCLDYSDAKNNDATPILAAEAIFHPPPASDQNKLRPASLMWRYERVEED